MIHLVIAEDHHLVRSALKALIQQCDDIEIVAEAENGQEAVSKITEHVPDVALLDLAMPILTGPQVAHWIREKQLPTKSLILSLYSDPTMVRQALRSGAKGFVVKSAIPEELILGIQKAAQGEYFLSPAITSAVLTPEILMEDGFREPLDRLTDREKQVLKLIAEGNTSQRIAAELGVGISTIEKHRVSLMDKLGIHSVAGLVRMAIKQNLIPYE